MESHEKKFAIPGENIRRLIPPTGSCYATDRITVDGAKVRFMYRVAPDNELDSGWRFFAGDESQDYADDPKNWAIYDANTIANYDPDIIPYLETPAPCAFEKLPKSHKYRPVDPHEDAG
jgi:hypothetical protein